MFIYLLIILVFWEGTAEANKMCDVSSHRTCFPSDYFGVPTNEEELNKACPIFLETMECLKTYAQTCGEDEIDYTFSLETHQKLIDFAKEICRKDSEIHLKVVENIGCINSAIKDKENKCKDSTSSKMDKLENYINELEKNQVEASGYRLDEWRSYSCLHHSLGVACNIAKIQERCGSEAKHLTMQLIDKSGFVEDFCQPPLREDSRELIQILELEMEEENGLKEVLYNE
ncbi:uncharacterized protein NPIL_170771 [Nephila pilipes]|uniref:Uncharacterized protein n=1 Tax=Nephila pilipes TaxID=299642 RepID=A0A8X6PW39_NEPPI|nr:uncharacterized protein NPIL_170771 [Nephila pilipes]